MDTEVNRGEVIPKEQREIVLLPINRTPNSYPERGAHPQIILNNQLADKSDMLFSFSAQGYIFNYEEGES